MEQRDILPGQEVIFHLRTATMRIAICDDDKKLVDEIKAKILEYANPRRLDVVVERFFSGEALLASTITFDLVFLDYQMKETNGLNTARVLRRRQNNCTIIFLTNYPHFVYEAFEVRTFRFWEKPFDDNKLFAALDDYFEMYGNDSALLLTFGRETRTINTADVVFLSAQGKRCFIHTSTETLQCSKTMAGIKEMLPRGHFYKIHKSFVVNFNYIVRYSKDTVYFKNGEVAYISRNFLTAFKTAYKNYSDLRNPNRIEQRNREK